jgi:hypothetical protein
MSDTTDRMTHNLARMREMSITPDEANSMIGALSGTVEMEYALDLIAERRARHAAEAES